MNKNPADSTRDQTRSSNNDTSFDGKTFAKGLPHKPGVYRMIGANDEVLYVGKAKDLKHRVASYFTGNWVNSRIWSMVQQIQAIQITLTSTEAEALLLESNLIKQHKTRYNVLLRDSKGYPFLYLSTQDDYPRLSVYRGKRKSVGDYFGPYPSVGAVNEAMQLLQKLFLVRQCEDSYFANRSRPCLQYQIKRCSAPCTGMIDQAAYQQSVNYTKAFLQGKSEAVIQALVAEMEQAAGALLFEKAAQIRDQIEQLRQITQQQYIVNGQGNVDVIALHYGSGVASIQVFTIRRGYNLGNQNFFPQIPQVDMASEEILAAFVAQYYLQRDVPNEIILSSCVPNLNVLQTMLSEKAERQISVHCRVRAERQKWLAMASQNALFAWQAQLSSKAGMQTRLSALQALLNLPRLPMRMECFDISHTLGEATVASCVVFNRNGAVKSAYRRFNIQGITAGDDYAAMQQALQRRFRKANAGTNAATMISKNSTEDKPILPDILLIDGGKGQVAQALTVLDDLSLQDEVQVVGVAKGEGRKAGLESLLLERGERRINLDPHDPALHLIQQIRDEAHRFAITAHRQKRTKARTTSSLEGIKGLGVKRRQQLLKHFGGLQAVRRASVEELAKVHGISQTLAQNVYDYFHHHEGDH